MTENLVFGIRPVVEAIEAGKQIEKLYIRKGAEGQLMTELRDLCLRHRVRVQEVPVEKLNRLVRGNHQGVVQAAMTSARLPFCRGCGRPRADSPMKTGTSRSKSIFSRADIPPQ